MERSCTRVQSVKCNFIILKLWEGMAWSLDLTDSQVQAVNLKILFASSQYGRGTHKSFRSDMLNFCTPRIDKIILLHKLQNFIQRSCQSWSSFANSHWGEALAYYTCAKQIIERYKNFEEAPVQYVHSVQLSHTGAQFANMDQRNCCALMPILFARLLVIYWCVSSFFQSTLSRSTLIELI